MANKKISELPVAQPIAGDENIPVSQSGSTRRVSISDILSALGVPTPAPGDAGLPLINDGADSAWQMLSATNVTTIYDGIEVRVSDLFNLIGIYTTDMMGAFPEQIHDSRVIFVGSAQPEDPREDELWWDTSEETIKRWDPGASQWRSKELGVGGGQGLEIYFSNTPPADPEAYDLWWNLSTDTISYYDDGALDWVEHSSGGGSPPPDPSDGSAIFVGTDLPATAEEGDVWWDTYYERLLRLDGSAWVPLYIPEDDGSSQIHISSAAPPAPGPGSVWWNTVDNRLRYWNDSTALWVAHTIGDSGGGIDIPISASYPGTPSTNDIWWDSNENVLKYWSGSAWVPHTVGDSDQITISSTPPSSPSNNALWWDLSLEELKRWSSAESKWLNPFKGVEGVGISKIEAITQANYDLITSPNPETLYVIVDGV